MGDLENKPSWSESRVKTLRQCRRQYWYNYYLSWGGWDRSASLESRQAYILKKMTNLPMWAGTVVHETIQQVIVAFRASECKEMPTLEAAKEIATQMLRRGWMDSTQKRWEKKPSKAVNLSEHFHNITLKPDATANIKAKVLRCLDNFYRGPVFERLRNLKPENFLESEEFQAFTMKTGEEVAVKLDWAYKLDGIVYLLDWKTGRAEQSVVDQLVTYAMYAIKKGWATRVEDIRIVPVFLDSNHDIAELSVTKEHLARQAGIIQREFPLIKQVHTESGDKSKFPVTDDPDACKWCNFKSICEGARKEIGSGETPF